MNVRQDAKNALADAAADTEPSPQSGWIPPQPAEFAADLSATHPQYEVTGFLGHGGMGAVYEARSREDGRALAIKMIHPDLYEDPMGLPRFQREIAILQRLKHDGIIELLNHGQTNGQRHFFVMPMLGKRTLAYYTKGPRLPIHRIMRLMQELCSAVSHAHKNGIIHRDLKPSNILLADPNERAVILDFGVSRAVAPVDAQGALSRTDDNPGTNGYMAPERAENCEAKETADVYSLGAILFELVTGQVPLGHPAPLSDFGLDIRFDAIIANALRQDPVQRLQSAEEFGRALAEASGTSASGLRKEVENSPAKCGGSVRAGQDIAASILNLPTRTEIIQWATECSRLCRADGDTTTAAAVDRALASYASGKFTVSFIGMAKRGKSTLINALLGRNDTSLAPVDKLPATSVATIYRWADTESVSVLFQNGATKNVGLEEIKDYVTEEGNPVNAKGVRHVIVAGPFSELLRKMNLVDLPGMGSVNALHSQTLFEFLPQSDAVLLLTTARMPINADEVELLRAVQRKDIHKVFVAINKIDATSADELADCENHNRAQLARTGVPVARIHKFSAKTALEGDMTNSGVPEFMKELSDFLARESESILANKLKTEVLCAASVTLEGIGARLSATEKSEVEIDFERAALVKTHQQALQEVEQNEKSFQKTWDEAIDEAGESLTHAKARVAARIAEELEQTVPAELNAFAKKFPANFNEALEEEAGPSLKKMETKLQELCDKLQVEYPSVSLGLDGIARIMRGTVADGSLGEGLWGNNALVVAGDEISKTFRNVLGDSKGTVVTPAAAVAAAIAGTFSSGLASFITAFGTTKIAAAAPSALLVAAGPLGLALAGIGAMVIPLAWRISVRLRKQEIFAEMERHVEMVFRTLNEERLPAFREFRTSILSKLRSSFEFRAKTIEEALAQASTKGTKRREDPGAMARYENLRNLLFNPPATY